MAKASDADKARFPGVEDLTQEEVDWYDSMTPEQREREQQEFNQEMIKIFKGTPVPDPSVEIDMQRYRRRTLDEAQALVRQIAARARQK